MKINYKKYSLEITFKHIMQPVRCKFIPDINFSDGETCFMIRRWLIIYVCFGWLSMRIQEYLRRKGIYWHDFIMNQCTKNFECCAKNLSEEDSNILKQICYARDEQIGTICINREE